MEILEKVHYDGKHGSPPTLFNNIKGIWRNVVPFGRIFLELKSDGSLGSVVAGPKSVKGKSFEVAEALGQAQLDRDKNGKVSLKNQARLVEVVQSSGDSQTAKELIAQHLKENAPGKSPKSNVHRLPTKNTPKKTTARLSPNDSPNKEVKNKPKAKPDNANEHGIDGALALLHKPNAKTEAAINKAHKALIDAANGTKDDVLKLRLEKIAHGLDAGTLSLVTARAQLKELVNHRNNGTPVKTPKPTKTEVNVLHDRAQVQNSIDNYKKELADLVAEREKNSKSISKERAQDAAAIVLLSRIEAKIRTPQIKMQLKQLRNDAENNNVGHRSILSRLIHILRKILSLGH